MEKNFGFSKDIAVVETDKGKVRGYSYDGMKIFKGIPYAKAERFHAPRELEEWEGVLDAGSFGYVCPLLEMPKPNGEVLIPHRYWLMDEDCLNLNIWTPGCDDKKRPVLVWLHGGGFSAGSAIEHVAYEGENMCREGQVVVVSINHRLNVLGYCDLSAFGEEYQNSGNAGTEDMIAALRWIQKNIARFGGDPQNVTLFGQSGGGAKITVLLQTPHADGLFAKGIVMSGTIAPAMADSRGSGKELVLAMMQELNIDEVKDLEKVPYSDLAVAYRKVAPGLREAGKYVGCWPQPNDFYRGEPIQNGFRKETAQIPLMVGSVFGEFTSFIPAPFDKHSMTREEGEKVVAKALGEEASTQLLPLFTQAYPERNPAELLLLDYFFRGPGLQYIHERSRLNDCTYSYLFNLDMPVDGGRTPWHCADIPYVFHNTKLVPVTQEAGVTEKIESQIFNAVMEFARTGNPNHAGIPYWPASEPEAEQVLIIDKSTRVVTNFDKELIPLLEAYAGARFASQMEENEEDIQH